MEIMTHKIFDNEYKELLNWFFEKRDKMERNAKPWSGGLDGEQTDEMRAVAAEYRARLKALRQKYGC